MQIMLSIIYCWPNRFQFFFPFFILSAAKTYCNQKKLKKYKKKERKKNQKKKRKKHKKKRKKRKKKKLRPMPLRWMGARA